MNCNTNQYPTATLTHQEALEYIAELTAADHNCDTCLQNIDGNTICDTCRDLNSDLPFRGSRWEAKS